MPLEMIREAISSLDGFTGQIGVMGGEPAMHPKFREVLEIWREMVPRHRRSLWTSGFRWKEYRDAIFETFDKNLVHFNNHTQTSGRHQPLLVAIDEVVDDPELRELLIQNCPYQAHWSASITPLGCYFCEIAGGMGAIFGIPGWPITPGWWKKTPSEFKDQVDKFCHMCSGAIPLPQFSDGRGGRDGPTKDVVSPGNLERLLAAGSPKAMKGHYQIWDRKITKEEIEAGLVDWKPRSFRDFTAHAPEDYDAASQR